jgi:hypothetical protein
VVVSVEVSMIATEATPLPGTFSTVAVTEMVSLVWSVMPKTLSLSDALTGACVAMSTTGSAVVVWLSPLSVVTVDKSFSPSARSFAVKLQICVSELKDAAPRSTSLLSKTSTPVMVLPSTAVAV